VPNYSKRTVPDFLCFRFCARSSFCREFPLCDAPETLASRAGGFRTIDEMLHFVDSEPRGELMLDLTVKPLQKALPPALSNLLRPNLKPFLRGFWTANV
jgi:hypothetical protein